MVQFVNLPVSRKELLKEQLGMSLGKGLADFANNYFANKSMEEVINDPSLKDSPVSERLSRLQSALTPYGETGMQVLQNRLGIEQQRAQEQQKSQQEALIKKKAPIFAKALRKEPLTEEEKLLLTPEEQLAIAKHHQRSEIEQEKRQQALQLEEEKHKKALELEELRQKGRTPKPTPYEAEKSKKIAQEQIKLEETIPHLQSSVKGLDRISELADQLKGAKGYIDWISGGAQSAELDALGLAAIEPIIKVFNPVGAIPTQKIELIKSKFAPKTTDLHGTLTGKINALKFYSNQALERAQKRLDLIKQYEGHPPSEVINAFDQESSQMLDAMTGEEKKAEQTFNDLPDASIFKDKKLFNKKTKQTVVSDGEKWIPQK